MLKDDVTLGSVRDLRELYRKWEDCPLHGNMERIRTWNEGITGLENMEQISAYHGVDLKEYGTETIWKCKSSCTKDLWEGLRDGGLVTLVIDQKM